jgi:prephenate dehydratase
LKKPEFHDDGFPVFNVKAVHALQKIISETNATLLLTTSHKEIYSLPKWLNIFKSRGINISRINKLPKSDISLNRKDEIFNWYQSKHKANERL